MIPREFEFRSLSEVFSPRSVSDQHVKDGDPGWEGSRKRRVLGPSGNGAGERSTRPGARCDDLVALMHWQMRWYYCIICVFSFLLIFVAFCRLGECFDCLTDLTLTSTEWS